MNAHMYIGVGGRLVVRTNETDCREGNRCLIEDKEINRLRDALYPFST